MKKDNCDLELQSVKKLINELDNHIFHYINKASMDCISYFSHGLARGGVIITFEEWVLLSAVIKDEGKNQNWYSQRINMDKTKTMRLIDSLEKKLYVRRTPDAEDRRQNLVDPTNDGIILMAHIMRSIKAGLEFSLKGIDEKELAVCKSVLLRILENLHQA